MVGENESMMIVSMWASITTRFTTPFLFCVTNLIIAILFIASKSNTKITTTSHDQQEHRQHEHEHEHEHEHVRAVILKPIVTRVTLLHERAKSIDLSSIIPTKSSQAKLPKYTSLSRLAQSIFFACSYDSQPDSKRYPSKKSPKPSPCILGRLKSIDFSTIYDDKLISTELQHISNSPRQLVRARVNPTKIRTPIKPETPSTTLLENLDPDHRVIRHNSEKTAKKKTMILVDVLKKSRTEVRNVWGDEKEEVNNMQRPRTARALRNATVDAKADDFITKFRGQLKLQRLDSLNRYNDMLRRPS